MTRGPREAIGPRRVLAGERGAMGLVFAGGVLGAPLRYVTDHAIPSQPQGFPLGIFVVNVVGAFLLGALLEGVTRSDSETGAGRRVRLFVGTGLLGAFTTYSTFAAQIELLGRHGRLDVAAAYALGSLAAGLAAVAAGIWCAHRLPASGAGPRDREVRR